MIFTFFPQIISCHELDRTLTGRKVAGEAFSIDELSLALPEDMRPLQRCSLNNYSANYLICVEGEPTVTTLQVALQAPNINHFK